MGEVLFFSAGPFRGAIPLADTDEVLRMVQPALPGPGALPWDSGTINLHGSQIPVIALRGILGIPVSVPDLSEMLIISKTGGRTIALRVDAVDGTGKQPPVPDDVNSDTTARAVIPGTYVSPEGIHVIRNLSDLLTTISGSNSSVCILPAWELDPSGITDPQSQPGSVSQPDAASISMLLEERARVLSHPIGDAIRKKTTKILTFRLADQQFGIALSHIREVVLTGRITRVPGTPGYITGICSIRGEIVSLVDLRALLPIPYTGITDLNRVIVVSGNTLTMGLLVDRITGIEEIDTGSLPVHGETDFETIDIMYTIPGSSLSFIDMNALFADSRMVIDES